MKKFFKGLMIFLLIILMIPVLVIGLMYTPIKSKNIVDAVEVSPEDLLSESLQDINIIDGGDASIKHIDIEKYLTYAVKESVKDEEMVDIDTIKFDGKENGEIKLRAYARVLPIKFPVRLTLKLNTENIGDYLNINVKSIKVGNIPLPKSLIGKLIAKEIPKDELESNEIINYIDAEDLEIELSYDAISTQFKQFGELGKLNIDEEGFNISVKPSEQLSKTASALEKGIKPIAKEIINSLDNIKKDLSQQEAKAIEKVETIITKIEQDNIEEVTAAEITEVVTEVKKLDEKKVQEIVGVLMKTTSAQIKENLIKTFAKNLSDEEVKEVMKKIEGSK